MRWLPDGGNETVQATDHKLLVAGEWIETGEWARGQEPLRRHRRRPRRRRRRRPGRARGRGRRTKPSAPASSPSTSAPRPSTAPPQLVAERVDDLALTIAAEAGKPIKTAKVEASRCVDTLTFSAVEARKLTGGTVPMDASAAGAGKLGVMLRVPYGVVGAISPFNFPLNLVAHKLGPGDRRRQRGRPQARRADADLGAEAGRDPARGRAARRLAERHPRPRLARSATRSSSTSWPRRSPSPARRRSAGTSAPGPAQEGQPRARLERAADRPRRRRLGDGRRQGPDPRLLARRPELHLDPAHPRPRGDRRRTSRSGSSPTSRS